MLKKIWLIILIIVEIFLIISLIIFYKPVTHFLGKTLSRQPTYWAVHLTNGQVYYGQIKSVKRDMIVLVDVYYLEPYQSQPAPSTGENFQLQPQNQTIYNFVKRGTVDPLLTDNVLFINRSVVLFWEKLKPESQIVKLIQTAKSQK
jgi:hypothetical protein